MREVIERLYKMRFVDHERVLLHRFVRSFVPYVVYHTLYVLCEAGSAYLRDVL